VARGQGGERGVCERGVCERGVCERGVSVCGGGEECETSSQQNSIFFSAGARLTEQIDVPRGKRVPPTERQTV
jgi:hypothetical protein